MAIETRTINGTLTEAYTSVEDSYMTQAKATHFHSFWTRKILAPTESIDDFKEVTASEKAKLEAADAAWERPPQSFIDAWNARADFSANGKYPQYVFGKYNEETGYFELNTLLDIDYAEAQEIMLQSDSKVIGDTAYRTHQMHNGIRTLMPVKNSGFIVSRLLCYDNNIQIIQLFSYFNTSLVIRSASGSNFLHSTNVHTILGTISIEVNASATTSQYLANVHIISKTKDGLTLNLASCAALTSESINYTIENSTKSLTLILHADAYARVTNEMFEKAAAKNITITSA